jgi:PKD repeat protein/glucose/arabinose dehydrogenase
MRFLTTCAVIGLAAAPLFANVPPNTPTITEPAVGRIVNPADVHMETAPFSDPDPGDTHMCSDWEIWTVSPLQRVWFTSCIGGVERVHTHLGDGIFQGSLAGHRELLPNTAYRLRVRHRDSSGDAGTEWSAYAERDFQTGEASAVFPLQAEDVADLPAPTWRNTTGQNVVLPAGGVPPSVRLETPDGGLLLEIRGLDGIANLFNNPPSLGQHAAVKVHVSAGSSSDPLALPESDLVFSPYESATATIYLPAMSVMPNTDLYFWVASSGSTFVGAAGQATPDFSQLARGNPVPWLVRQAGYRVEVVASGLQLPCNITFVPNPGNNPNSPLYYVTELYGAIKTVTRDGTVYDYATNLLNYNPTGAFPGSGEQGVTGVVVDPTNGDLYATMLYSSVPGQENVPHYPKVVRFTSTDGGLTAATQTTILDMPGESQGQSHQISNITIGPDAKLYVHMGDGFDFTKGQDLNSYRGKILRMNRDGSVPLDNPFYNAADGITSRDYVFAYGLRNPFGGAWRQADGFHYEVENGPSVDRICKVVRGRNYLYDGSDQSMTNFALYNWVPAVGPVNCAFIQPGTFGGSGFPAEKMGHMFVAESGGTWSTGPQTLGKKISEWVLDADGNIVGGPTTLIEYSGAGKASCVGLAAGPDGLYFTDLYKDLNYMSPMDRGAHVLRVRFVGDADFTASATSGAAPLAVSFTDVSTVPGATAWAWDFGDGATSTEQNPMHTYEEDGVYTVRLTVTGSAGLSIEEKPAYIRVGALPRIAFIVSAVPPAAAEANVADHLRAIGYDVTPMDQNPANRPSAAQVAQDYGLVMVSSTINSGNVAGQFRTANVPMIFWENALLRSGRESLMDNGNVVSDTGITIVNNTHPITAGFSVGTAQVFTTGSNMSVGIGNTGPGTQVLARRFGSSDGAIIAAEAGATVADGYVTPARRVFFFIEDNSWLNTTPVARTLFDRSVCWAMNIVTPMVVEQPQDATATVGDSVTLTARAEGSSPLSYRWRRAGQAIPGATTRSYTIESVTPSDAGDYDVVVTNTCGTTTSEAATLTVVGCACDWDHSGSISSQDFFDFLNDFFENNADFNHSGATDSQDFFDFLSCFFGGC